MTIKRYSLSAICLLALLTIISHQLIGLCPVGPWRSNGNRKLKFGQLFKPRCQWSRLAGDGNGLSIENALCV